MSEPVSPSTPLNLLRPLYLIYLSASFIPRVVLTLLWTRQLDKFTSWQAFQHAWFGRFWTYFGPLSRNFVGPWVEPLLAEAHGVVLDIGPGSGEWLRFWNPAHNPNITKMYGVEPNPGHHPGLRANITKAGLDGIYEILPVGVEDLQSCGIAPGSIDTIATVQVLCSVPGPERIIKELYPYLKPGGQWLVFEHIRTPYQHDFVASWQRFVDRIWPHFFDGCCITRPTDEWLLQAGAWETVNLHPVKNEGKFDTVPHVMGTLIKSRDEKT